MQRYRPSLPWEILFVLLCGGLVCTAAAIQLLVVIGLPVESLRPAHFVLPGIVGLLFGALGTQIGRTLHRQREQGAALERERARVQALHDQMVHLADERLAMLGRAHGALHQAERQAAAGLQAGAYAHDLRNLLGVVAHIADAVRHGDHTDDDLDALEHATLRAADLTQRLLSLVRERAHEPPQTLDLTEALRPILPLLARIAGDDHRWRTELAPGVQAWAHTPDLELALLNLVRNACDAAPPGSPITVRSYATAHHAVLEVVDEGLGMTPRSLERAQLPLQTTKSQGTGLGLSIVNDLLAACGGRLELQSTPGEGTTARMHLRASAPTSLPDPQGPGHSPSSPTPRPSAATPPLP